MCGDVAQLGEKPVVQSTLERQGDRLQWSNNKFDDTAAWMIKHWSCTRNL